MTPNEQARLVVAAGGILNNVAVMPAPVVAAYERALIDMGLNPQSIANKALKEAKE